MVGWTSLLRQLRSIVRRPVRSFKVSASLFEGLAVEGFVKWYGPGAFRVSGADKGGLCSPTASWTPGRRRRSPPHRVPFLVAA